MTAASTRASWKNTTQLNLVLKDFKELIDKINEKGLRSIY